MTEDPMFGGIRIRELVPLDQIDNGRLIVTCASDVKPEKVQWLWQDRVPLGKCTLFAGEGGLGKSMVLAWIAATVSRRGKEWPCQEGVAPYGSVIILSAEDDAADTIVPRLIAADADCSKIHIVSAVRREDDKGNRSFSLQADLPELERKIRAIGDVLLVIIDPVTSYLGAVDSHKNAELRSVLEPLGEMAARLKVTIIANTHLSKATSGSANNRVIGSVAFVNHARAAHIVTPDPDDAGRRFFLPSKTNLGRMKDGLAYRIVETTIAGCDGELIWAPHVKWDDAPVRMSADEAVAASGVGVERGNAVEEAKTFLRETLSGGPVSAKDVKRDATDAGIAAITLRRARLNLKVDVNREGGLADKGQWMWSLPDEALLRCSSASSERVSTLDKMAESSHLSNPLSSKMLTLRNEHLSNGHAPFDAEGQEEKDRPRCGTAADDGDPFATFRDPNRRLAIGEQPSTKPTIAEEERQPGAELAS